MHSGVGSSYRRFSVVLLSMASLLAFHGSLAAQTSVAAQTSNDTRLIEAAKRRDHQAVRGLLAQGAAVNGRQADGATALHWASYRDDAATAELLLQAHADVNAVNELGVTPLSLACTNGSAPMIERLLKAGANPNATRPSGETVLMTCARTGNPAAVAALLAAGADASRRETLGGQTALMWAAAEKYPNVVRVLVQHGADVNVRSKGKSTALAFAAQQGDIETARILLGAGATWERFSTAGCKASNRLGAMALDRTDSTDPLMIATVSNHEAFAIFMLENGADAHASDCTLPVLFYAIKKGLAEARHTTGGAADDPQVRRPNMDRLVKVLLDRGVDPNMRLPVNTGYLVNTKGATPLLLAAASFDLPLMRLLLEHGADPKLATEGNTTPLMFAAGVARYEDRFPDEEAEAFEAVKLLVELGADVNAVNEDEHQTALHGAAFVGGNETIQYLVGKGARMDLKDAMGQTPLSIALGVRTKGSENCGGLGFCFQKVPAGPHPVTAELLLKLGATPLEQSGVEFLDVEATGKSRPPGERERRQ